MVGEKGFKAQRKWWKLNGMKLRLMDMSTELRMMMYEHALGPRLYPISTISSAMGSWADPVLRHNAAVHWGFGFYNADDRECYRYDVEWLFGGSRPTTAHYSVCRPNLALLQVSSQVSQEASWAGWEHTRKCFFSMSRLELVLDASRVPNYNWLNKVILNFTMSEWFDFFGVKTHPHFQLEASSSRGNILPALPKLINLQMWFGSPDDGYMFSPWGNWSTHPPYTCCQRVMVDWIMTFAWPFIRDIPKVIIGGAVKKYSKLYWDRLFALLTKDKAEVIDYQTEEAAIFSTPPAHLPPPCTCRTSCSVNHATRKEAESSDYRKEDRFDYEDDA